MLTKQAKLAFIGTGAMGSSIAKGLKTSLESQNILVYDRDLDKAQQLAANEGFQAGESYSDLFKTDLDALIIAVKPNDFKALLEDLKTAGLEQQTNCLIISIAAGIEVASIAEVFPQHAIARVMPNTPAQINKGASAIAVNDKASEEQQKLAQMIFDTVGTSVFVEEDQMNAVTALSGSGPAYFFLLIESMIEAGITLGLPKEVATKLATATAEGACSLAAQSDMSAEELRKQVTSPNGTTHAAITSFQGSGFEAITLKALTAAKIRGEELAS